MEWFLCCLYVLVLVTGFVLVASIRFLRVEVQAMKDRLPAPAENNSKSRPDPPNPTFRNVKAGHEHLWTRIYYVDADAAARARVAVLARSSTSHPTLTLPPNFAFWRWPGSPPRICAYCRKLHPADYVRLCDAGWWAGDGGLMRPPNGEVISPALHADLTGVPAKSEA